MVTPPPPPPLRIPEGQIVYKIRRKDGLFSMGGGSPSFNKTGKIWKRQSHLTNHLNLVDLRPMLNGKSIYDNCEVIIYRLYETQINTMSLSCWIKGIKDRKQKTEDEKQKRFNKQTKEKRRKMFEDLKEEFEG